MIEYNHCYHKTTWSDDGKGITKPSILIVADDFTGANDAGVSLAQVGHTVDVAFEMPYRGDASVWVINSDSRAMDPKLAAMKITSLMSHLPLANNPPLVIKKIDSTLRGNIGAEIEALMKACGITGAVVAPHFLRREGPQWPVSVG